MSKFFKNILNKERNNSSNDITNYLISEIEDIVSKKIGDNNLHDSIKENNTNNYKFKEKKKDREYEDEENSYMHHINYNLKEEQPFSAVNYIDNESPKNFLPFEEKEIKPKVYNEDQIRSIVRKTLKPALNQWLDENLDIIIEKAIKKNYDKYVLRPKRRSRYYDE